jgi:hypothetical protein
MTSFEYFEWVMDAKCQEALGIKNEAIAKFKGNGFVEKYPKKAERAYQIFQYIKQRQPQGTHN